MMNNFPQQQDVVVIGGGPAGSTIASLLARKGHSVSVLEREKFPREHVGESRLPFCYGLFEDLGILDKMKQDYVRKPGVQFISPNGDSHTTYCFGHVIKDDSHLSFHVIRAQFDDLLLQNSRRLGASVFEETKVTDVELETEDGMARVHYMSKDGSQGVIEAKQVVDASGQYTFLAKKLQTKKAFDNLDRIAFATHWMVEKMPEGLDEGILQIVYLGGDKLGWIFVIPVGVNRISVGVVVNNSYMKQQKELLMQNNVKDWQQQFYLDEVASSGYVSKLLKSCNARQRQPVLVNGDYSYYTEVKYGNNFAITGDASAFLDPIFASGVYLSMKSSYVVADALDKKLKSGDQTNNQPLEDAYNHIKGAYDLVGKFIYFFYNPEAFSLAEVSNEGLKSHMKHDTAFSLVHYLLAGDFFTEHRKYQNFLELIQNPKQFEKFKHLVLDAADHETPSCGADRSKVFSEFLRESASESTVMK